MTTPESPLSVVDEWEDEPAEGQDPDEWPYPTKYTRSLAHGELAERIRRALGVTDDLPVYVEERIESGGYSEYTQEDDYYMTIKVGDTSREVIDGSWSGGLTALLQWLDKAAPVAPK